MGRWLVLLSLLLASWQVLGAVRWSEPCCDDPCDPVMACVAASCSACAERALSATVPAFAPVCDADERPSAVVTNWSSATTTDIWKPPRTADRSC